MTAPALLAMAIALSAAAPVGTYPVRGDTGHHCDARKVKALVGRTRSPSVERAALRLSGAAFVRWIPKDSAVTMDYRPDRLDLHLDRRGRIARVSCG